MTLTISKERTTYLRHICNSTESQSAILWLRDCCGSSDLLQLSHAYNISKSLEKKLPQLNVKILVASIEGSSLEEYVTNFIQIANGKLKNVGFDHKFIQYFAVSSQEIEPNLAFSHPDSMMGIIGLIKPRKPIEIIERTIAILALNVSSGRDRRIVEAVKVTQNELQIQSGANQKKLAHTLDNICALVRDQIGATTYLLIDQNNLRSNGLFLERTGHTVAKKITEQIDGPLHVCRPNVNVDSKSRKPLSPEHVLYVPLKQSAFVLEQQKFVTLAEISNNVERKQTVDIHIIFFGKNVPGYYQQRFSLTDENIARAVFGYIDQYASARIFEENYEVVNLYLNARRDRDAIQPDELLKLLQQMSTRFRNLFQINAGYEANEIDLKIRSAKAGEELPAEYVKRLRDAYLKPFLENHLGDVANRMLIGVDRRGNVSLIEFHFPNQYSASRLFIIHYEGKEITESVFRAICHLFGEIQVRTQKYDYDIERASSLQQTRHTLIHHFAAANKSMKHLQPLWAKGQRSTSYWQSLTSDPVVATQIPRARWSLAQAILILENGRFLLGQINPTNLNRKNINIVDIVQDCFSMLQDERDRKNIAIVTQIVGNSPRAMNADEALLRIAILNLVDNALKYSESDKVIKWSVKYKEISYEFRIMNAGPPLDRSRKNLLFQVGARGKQHDRLNPRHGTGLGLPVAQKILRAHSKSTELDFKEVRNDSDLGEPGNVFFFEMPYLTGTTNR